MAQQREIIGAGVVMLCKFLSGMDHNLKRLKVKLERKLRKKLEKN